MMEALKPTFQGQLAVIIPACDEEACIGRVLDELLAALDPEKFTVAVGVNASSDRTAEIARGRGVWVAETGQRGYGYGCQSAIDLLANVSPPVRAYIFLAGDGASDPRDVRKLVDAYEQGYAFVLGARTAQLSNWRTMRPSHVIANFAVALWCGVLAGRWFKDLAPVRLIERNLFDAIAPREMTFGWTIEAQIAAARLGASICEVSASERPRLAGQQKVSGVTWRRTFAIGCRILAAGWRTRLRFRRSETAEARHPEKALVAQPQRGA
ncbi:MAG TPA: glycosyltransferase [Chthoniobacterales bacterium]|nr:glycosyltransferase [Chthoniobacterales bacterium]